MFKLQRLSHYTMEVDLSALRVLDWPPEALDIARRVLAANLPAFYLQLPDLRREWLIAKVEEYQRAMLALEDL